MELDALSARVAPDLIFYAAEDGPSQVVGTARGDLLPAICRPALHDTSIDYEQAARCFVGASLSLLRTESGEQAVEGPQLAIVANEPGGIDDPPEQYLRFEQHHRGFPVEGHALAFVFVGGRLVTVTGRFTETASFALPAIDEQALTNAAEALFGPDTQLGGFTWNASSAELEVIFHDGLEEHRLSAQDGSFRSTRLRGHALEVNKTINIYQYPASVYLGTSGTTSPVSSKVTCTGNPGTCDVAGSGTCRYWPRQAVYDADRVTVVNVTYSGGSETTVFEDDPCGSSTVFNQWPWNSAYTQEHYAASARRNLDEAADILNHSESFFWVYPRTPMSLKLNVNAILTPGLLGLYTSFDNKINLRQDPSPYGYSAARNLDVITHEFGHYAHHTYGFNGKAQVSEGWADQFPLRLAIHRRFVTGQWPSLQYLTDLAHMRGHRTQRVLRQGEYILDQYPPATDPSWMYVPNSYCPVENQSSEYYCGALIGMTYWTLAFDSCRSNYLNCVEYADIIRYSGGYQNSAWRLANSAYAYAIKNISGSGDIGEFHNLVALRYGYFASQNYMDWADYDRVTSVLGAHCLGPMNLCPGRHHLPQSPLPSAHTEKHPLFREAEDAQHWYSSQTVFSTNTASKDKYVSFGSTGMLRFTVSIPTAGTYRIHFVAKAYDVGYDEIHVYDPGTSSWKNAGPFSPLEIGWTWRSDSTGDADVTYSTSGTKDLWLSAAPSHISGFILDAIWLEKL